MPPISASITSSLVSSLSNRFLNPRFIFRYTPLESPISIFVDLRTVSKRSFSVIQGNGGLRASSNMSSNGGDAGKRMAQFNLSPTSVLKIQKGDITRWFIDGSSDAIGSLQKQPLIPLGVVERSAYILPPDPMSEWDLLGPFGLVYMQNANKSQRSVNPANERMLGGGGADGAIHQAAGPELRTACYDVPEVRPGVRCPTGEARITPGFKLPASHVIHTVGPIYDANSNVAALLSNAYRNSLRVARENNIQYIAFPAISCGVFRYPLEEAATVAISTIKEHCNDIKEAHFVLFSDDIYNVWFKKAEELLQN